LEEGGGNVTVECSPRRTAKGENSRKEKKLSRLRQSIHLVEKTGKAGKEKRQCFSLVPGKGNLLAEGEIHTGKVRMRGKKGPKKGNSGGRT